MKKYLIHICLFFIIVFIIDVGFGKFCAYAIKHAKGGETKPLQYIAYECDKDIIILGSSRALHHYDDKLIEEQTRIKTYNAGMDGVGCIAMYARYKLLIKHHHPQLIIYDIEPLFDIYDYDDAGGTRYTAHLKVLADDPDVYNVITDVDPDERIKLKSSLYKYNIVFVSNIADWLLRSSSDNFGYEPLQGKMNASQVYNYKTNLIVSQIKLKYLNKLIADTKKDGVKLVFLASPKYGASSDNLWPIKNLCQENNLEFWDYTNTEKYNRMELFKEPMHLNYEGSQLFTLEIINRLQQASF